jgi:mono/diheme cytochrome c family protein
MQVAAENPAADGRALFPLMKFNDMSDADLEAVLSYLRTVPPAAKAVRVRELNLLGRVVKALVMKPVGPSGPVPASVTPGATAEYGHYLATSVAACVGCHTRRDLKTGAVTGPLFAGGLELKEAEGTFVTPNLTPDPTTGRVTTWTEETFVNRFHLGPQLPGTPMPWRAFGRMSDDDLRAIYRFLRTVPAARSPQT